MTNHKSVHLTREKNLLRHMKTIFSSRLAQTLTIRSPKKEVLTQARNFFHVLRLQQSLVLTLLVTLAINRRPRSYGLTYQKQTSHMRLFDRIALADDGPKCRESADLRLVASPQVSK